MNYDNTNIHEYVGNLHIHSRYSDGEGTVREIARTAGSLMLDFIILNDHSHMTQSVHLEDEGYYEGVMVLMGQEIGMRYHHYLAFDLPDLLRDQDLTPQSVIDLVNRKGGFGFIAHPFEKGMPFRENSIAYTWNDLSVTGYTGICIWNFSSRWKERVTGPLTGLFFLLFKTATLKGPSRQTLRFWDDQNARRKVPAVGGSDAHGTWFQWGPLRFKPLPYSYTLGSINVHLLMDKPLTGDFHGDRARIYGAIRQGRSFIANNRLAPARGFRFFFVPEKGTPVTMGEEVGFQRGIIRIQVPHRGEIRLLRDGAVINRWRGTRGSCHIREGGVYRVEVFRPLPLFGPRPWIFSNPIYLR
ncbi:MAG TPA: hypothetical protein ENH37_12165 [Deltaproteobacteria bacterium]|nr:hypothetical protein [Deltaproteobacteria bacterium]